MDCCSPNGLDEMFNESAAKKELRAYQKKGLDKRARSLVDFLSQQDISGATLLEIGGGIGAVHLELMEAGAAKGGGSRRFIGLRENGIWPGRKHGIWGCC